MSSYFEQLKTATQQLSVTICKCALKSSMNKTKIIYEPNLIKSKQIHKLGKAAKNVGQNLNYNKQSLTNSEGYLVRILKDRRLISYPYLTRRGHQAKFRDFSGDKSWLREVKSWKGETRLGTSMHTPLNFFWTVQNPWLLLLCPE